MVVTCCDHFLQFDADENFVLKFLSNLLIHWDSPRFSGLD